MKKILLISKEWAPAHNTGLGNASQLHEKILKKINYKVITVSSRPSNKDVNFKLKGFLDFILNLKFFFNKADNIIKKFEPDIVMVESMQTVISEIFLYKALQNKKKIIIISHGISIFPYKFKIKYILRFAAWCFYIPLLIFFLKRSNLFLTLDSLCNDKRFFDTHLIKKYNKNFLEYNNCSRFENYKIKNFKCRTKTILCIGYVDHIKNQLDLVFIANKVKDLNINIKIIYNNYNQKYFNNILKKIKYYNLKNIILLNDAKINLLDEIQKSWLLINTSITEVSPLSLIEGNCLKIFFLSYDVGRLNKFGGGIVHYSLDHLVENIRSVYQNNFFHKKLKKLAEKDFLKNYTQLKLKNTFLKIKNVL